MSLAVYVHIPFCVAKCGYCDFNAYANLDDLKPRYADALLDDVATWSDVLAGDSVHSISFGGGTPGEFPAADLVRVVQAVRGLSRVEAGAEVSLEANPGTADAASLRRLVEGGFNRVSFGAQSFDPAELQFLDRVHSPQAARASVANARAAGFQSTGLDLIYGLPGQPLDAWVRSLRAALALAPEHLSCYALTVEEGTPLGLAVERGRVPEPDPDDAAAMYEAAEELLASAGYRHYELSNWALPGHESRHNLTYWAGGDYLGIGAGAHGYVAGERFENIAHPGLYSAAGQPPRQTPRPFVAAAYIPELPSAIADWFEARLRLVDGMDMRQFQADVGVPVDVAAGPPLEQCEAFGLLTRQGDNLRLTPRGRLLHSEVIARILAYARSQFATAAGLQ